MEVKHYELLLKLYKDKVNDSLTDEEVRKQKLKAKIALDNAVVRNNDINDIVEFIKELEQL